MIKAKASQIGATEDGLDSRPVELETVFDSSTGQLIGITIIYIDVGCGTNCFDTEEGEHIMLLMDEVTGFEANKALRSLKFTQDSEVTSIVVYDMVDYFALESLIKASKNLNQDYELLTLLQASISNGYTDKHSLRLLFKALALFAPVVYQSATVSPDDGLLAKRPELEACTFTEAVPSTSKGNSRFNCTTAHDAKQLLETDYIAVYTSILSSIFGSISDTLLSQVLMSFGYVETIFNLTSNPDYNEARKNTANVLQLIRNKELSGLFEQYTNLCTLEKCIVNLSTSELPLHSLKSFETIKHEKLEQITARVAHNSKAFELLSQSLKSSTDDQLFSNFILNMNIQNSNTTARLKLLNKLIRYGSLSGDNLKTLLTEKLNSAKDEDKTLAIELVLVTMSRRCLVRYSGQLLSTKTWGLFLHRSITLGFFEQLEWLVQYLHTEDSNIKNKETRISLLILKLMVYLKEEVASDVLKTLIEVANAKVRSKIVLLNYLQSFRQILMNPKLLRKFSNEDIGHKGVLSTTINNLLAAIKQTSSRSDGLIAQYGTVLKQRLVSLQFN